MIEAQKQFADLALEQIELIDPSAIVAGGAPRNWSMDQPARGASNEHLL